MGALESKVSLPHRKKNALEKFFKFPIVFMVLYPTYIIIHMHIKILRTETHIEKHSFHPTCEVFLLPHGVYSILF